MGQNSTLYGLAHKVNHASTEDCLSEGKQSNHAFDQKADAQLSLVFKPETVAIKNTTRHPALCPGDISYLLRGVSLPPIVARG